MKLAIFDIDGTLTKSSKVDRDCFLQAAQQLIHPSITAIEAEAFTHFTDQNMTIELHEWHLERQPSAEEYERFRSHYLKLLESVQHKTPLDFRAIDGAASVLQQLGDDWQVAVATGCWAASAELKLRFGQVDSSGIPKGTSDDHISRHGILQTAIEKAKQQAKVEQFEHTVYIGDGIWDLLTCQDLGIPFVGIEAEGNAQKKEALGAFCQLADYSNLEEVRMYLNQAQVPN